MSNQYTKKEYDISEIKIIISKYKSGISFTKIATELGRKKNNIKEILINNNVWIEGRDSIKKEFSNLEIEKIKDLYLNGFSCEKIAKLFNVSKTPIKDLLKKNNILRVGNSNGVKLILTEEQKEKIKNLYLNEYKNCYEISLETGLTESYINKFLNNSGFRRNKSIGVSAGLVKRYRGIPYCDFIDKIDEYYKYELAVKRITNKQPIENLINYDKRGKSGVNGAYHLDHKFSIIEGFKNNIKPEIIGSINNLEFIPWEENLLKRAKCSITKEQLINL